MKYAIGPILTACLALCPVPAASPAATAAPEPAMPRHEAVAGVLPLEVRLRKLHLVRPDLQRFPIPYDTVC